MNEQLDRMNEKELIIMRDALKEYAISMRMRDGKVVYSNDQMHDKLIKESTPAQYAFHPYVIAQGMIKDIEKKIR